VLLVVVGCVVAGKGRGPCRCRGNAFICVSRWWAHCVDARRSTLSTSENLLWEAAHGLCFFVGTEGYCMSIKQTSVCCNHLAGLFTASARFKPLYLHPI
jgi:hypothetical protein